MVPLRTSRKKRRCQKALASWQRYLLPARALCDDHRSSQTVTDPGPIDRQPRADRDYVVHGKIRTNLRCLNDHHSDVKPPQASLRRLVCPRVTSPYFPDSRIPRCDQKSPELLCGLPRPARTTPSPQTTLSLTFSWLEPRHIEALQRFCMT